MKKLSLIFSALMLCLTLTACGSDEPASATSVVASKKSIVQEKLNKSESKTETESKDEDNQSESAPVSSSASSEEQTTKGN